MLRIGLTGGIATGKTLVAQYLQEAGAIVIDTDLVAHQLMAPGGAAYSDVLKTFGQGILAGDGTLDRRALGALIFNDAAAREQLNGLVHPHVKAEIKRLESEYLAQEEAQDRQFLLVVVIPLLFEVNMAHFVDITVVVYCPADVQQQRLMARNGWSPEEAQARMRSQLPIEDKVKKAEEVIDNSHDPDLTREQVVVFLRELKNRFGWEPYHAA